MTYCYVKQRRLLFVIFLFVLSIISPKLYGQGIIINEIYNSSSTDEWIEFLVVQDSLDIRSWDFRDYSAAGAAQLPCTFTTSSLWSSLRKGTVIVVGTSSTTFTEDTDPSDYLLMIKITNGSYFSFTTAFSIAGSSDAVEIRDASDTHIFGVSWGAGNAASLPAPKVHFAGAATSATSTVFNEDTTPELTSTTNWTQNTVTTSQGAGNSVTNSAWITTLRAHPDGSGNASATPDTMMHGNTYSIDITFRRDTTFALTDMRIIVPPAFIWSHDDADVSYTNMTATQSISGDTIYFNGVTLADSTVITIANVTAPDSTAKYFLQFQTKSVANYDFLSPSPSIIVLGLPQPIAVVKENDVNGIPLRLGQLVTVRGILTVGNEFGSPSYIQDNTGGIGFFDPSISSLLSIGDEIVLTGTVAPFNGLCELTNLLLQEIASTGNTVEPVLVTASQIANDGAGGVEAFEGMLVRVDQATVTDLSDNSIANWTVAGSGTNYRLHDGSGFVDLRVDNNVNYANTPAPQSAFDVIGVVGQFKASSPYTSGYQFMPRASSDILSDGPMFATTPYETDITSSSMRINWATIDSGSSRLRYGTTTAYELGTVSPDDLLRTTHAIDITGLSAATIYHVQAFSVKDPDTSIAGDLIVSTASPSATTGQMNVYFNKSVNTDLAISQAANGNQNLISRIVTRINAANHSIDAAFYNLSGVSEGSAIATALVSAKARGVAVRVICEQDNRSNAPFNSISAAGIPIITDSYDLVWGGQALSHNKFAVIDYSGGTPDSVWVWTGSWNPTNPGTNDDRQNSIEIQDVALAGAYTAEFNEMWGSSTSTPNQSLTRFGARKRDNTPHHFNIKGVAVESYFSPSDHTTSRIASTLKKAQHSASEAILSFTRKDLADTLIARKNAGKKVRVLVDNNTDTGNQFAYMQSNGIDIHLKGGGAGLLHHKYATIDGDQVNGPQYTVTGSHNWSNSAENSNDENTIIIENNSIANQYLQEFAARYYEAGGTDSIHIQTIPLFSVAPSAVNFGTVDSGSVKQDSVVVSNTGNSPLTVSMATSTNVVFWVTPDTAAVAPSSSQKFYINFGPTAGGLETGSIIFTHNAAGNPDTLTVQGTGHVDTTVTQSDTTTITYHIISGWNMISVSAKVDDPRKATLFPASTTNAFAYNGVYVPKPDTLLTGVGYWLKFASPASDSIRGVRIDAETLQVRTGWNIIGTPSNKVLVSSIVPSPTGIVLSNYYGYNGAYFVEDTLVPGRAYWVKTTAGTLELAGSQSIPKTRPADELAGLNTLTAEDALGYSQKLRFGSLAVQLAVSRYEAPPVAPGDGFDLRFASGRMVEFVQKEEGKTEEFPVVLTTPNFPVKISWTIDSKDNNHYTLKIADAETRSAVKLSGSGDVVIHSAIELLTLSVTPQRAKPQEYALGQNYPNPFNPRTTIPFSLPEASTVTLKVYNILGAEVATVLTNADFEAGYFESPFDASQLASGVYMYRLSTVSHGAAATSFHQEKKLLFIK